MNVVRNALVSAVGFAVWLVAVHAWAGPPPVVDTLWSVSQPWSVFTLSAPETVHISLSSLSATCQYPIPERPLVLCGTPQIDLWIHLIQSGAGEVGTPIHCVPTAGSPTTCSGQFSVLASGSYALLVHGGTAAQGRMMGYLQASNGLGTTHITTSLDLSDNIMVNVANPENPYDLVSVLMPDGPRPGFSPPDPGNTTNDQLGVDATEAWLLDADGRILSASIAQNGVGAASNFSRGSIEDLNPTYALVRPWNRPTEPFDFYLNGKAFYYADGSKSPTVGPGRMRVVFNDWYSSDADRDRVSNRVEQWFNTCDGVGSYLSDQFYCLPASVFFSSTTMGVAPLMDPRDTDGDGLSDYVEILGTDVTQAVSVNADGSCQTTNTSRTWQSDVDQTFPLWGFDPRHKDALVEIDITAPTPTGQTCSAMTPLLGCPAAESWGQPALGTALGFEPLNTYFDSLNTWRQEYAALSGTRVNNPDRMPGITLHFDVSTASVPTARHGTRPAFGRVLNPSASYPPTMVIYTPLGQSGSSCSCGQRFQCTSQRHGGYARLASVHPGAGGGQSSPGGPITGSILNGGVPAHEMGHHLQLAHGGPNAASPFLPRGAIDNRTNYKIAHYSSMNYGYPVAGPFSVGLYGAFPLPRPSVAGGTDFGFPEVDPLGNWEYINHFTSYVSTQTLLYGPGDCGPSGTCWQVDFDRNGSLGGHFQGVVQPNGAYETGRSLRIRVQNYFCAAENRANAGFRDACCPNGTRDAMGACPNGVMRSEQPVSNTMLLAGRPALTVANNRLVAFFLDDAVPDPILPGQTDPVRQFRTRCMQAPCPVANNAVVRWTAMDGFVRPAGNTNDNFCLTENADCTQTNPTNVGGLVTVDGLPIVATGTTQLSAAQVTPASGGARIFLGVVRRAGLLCPPETPACTSSWAPALVASAPDNGSMAFQAHALSFPSGYGDNVDAAAVAAWNPAANGDATRAMVVMRDAPSRRLLWTTCDGTGCDAAQLLLEEGTNNEIFPRTSVALAVAAPAPNSQVRELVLVHGDDAEIPRLGVRLVVPGTMLRARELRLLRGPGQAGSEHRWTAPVNAAVSAAFAGGGRSALVISSETFQAAGDNRLFRITTEGDFLTGSGFVVAGTFDTGEWRYTRPTLITLVNSVRTFRFTDAPGNVEAYAFDGRPGQGGSGGVPTIYQNRLRSIWPSHGQNGVELSFMSIAEPVNVLPGFNYDEVSTLGWALCPTLAGTSLGIPGGELAFWYGSDPSLRCPAAAAWAENAAAPLHLASLIGLYCQYPCLRDSPDPRALDEIVSALVAPGFSEGVVPIDHAGPELPSLLIQSGQRCWTGNEVEEQMRLTPVDGAF